MPEGIRRQVVAFEDKRRFERNGIVAITGAGPLQVCVVGQDHISCEPEGEISKARINLINLLNAIGKEGLGRWFIRGVTSVGDVFRRPTSRNLACIDSIGQIAVNDEFSPSDATDRSFVGIDSGNGSDYPICM